MKEKIINGLKWFYRSYIWLFIVLLGIDILSKQLVMHSGVTPPNTIVNLGIVKISYVLNPNAAFGIGADNPTVSRIIYLVFASIITIGLVFYLIYKRKTTKLYVRACLIMVVAGAIGNMIDRIFYASTNYCVVDWIDFYWFWGYNFNIADSCIVVAAFMLAIYLIVLEVKEYRKKRKSETLEVKTLSKTEKERLEEEKAEEVVTEEEEKQD